MSKTDIELLKGDCTCSFCTAWRNDRTVLLAEIKAKDEEIARLTRIVELDEQIEQALKGEL